MQENKAIITAYQQAKTTGTGCVLATVVHVEGSAYRRAGARMLVDEYGQMTGAISGGCLEGDALRKALHALERGQNRLVTYDTSDEDDAAIGAQLGCNGVIQVLFEPLNFSDQHNPVELLQLATANRQPAVLLSFFNLNRRQRQPGTCLLFSDKLKVSGRFSEEVPALMERLQDMAAEAIQTEVSRFAEVEVAEESWQVFFQVMLPPVHLVVAGAGNDARVLAQMAELLGWEISIADGRPSHASPQRFTSACQVRVTRPEQILDGLALDSRTVFVLMTHNYQYDLAVLKLLLNRPEVPYIGMLGPKKKYRRMLDDLSAEGITLSGGQQARIFAPVGLDLGAETPAEIALSMLSEIQAMLTGGSATPLRQRDGPIHQPRPQPATPP